jgi:hypothetical protein
MGLQWETIPTDIRRNLEQSLLGRGNDFSVSLLSGFVKGSTGLNYRWDENLDMKKLVYHGIKRYYGDKNRIPPDSSQGISNIIYGFGEMELKWADFPKEIKECIYNGIEKNSSGFTSQEISNILYG